MIHKKIFQFGTLLFLIGLLIGCTQTEKEILQAAEQNASNVFYGEKEIEPNYTEDALSFYLPQHLHVVDIDENNIILEGTDDTYIIFNNVLERTSSRLHYNSASEDADLISTFETDDQFGYLRIIDDDLEDQYELQAGIGGVKITTHTELNDIPAEAKEIMKIAQSMVESNVF